MTDEIKALLDGIAADTKTAYDNAAASNLTATRAKKAAKSAQDKTKALARLLSTAIPIPTPPVEPEPVEPSKDLWHPDRFPDQMLFVYDAEKMTGDPVAYVPPGLLGKAHLTEAATKRPTLVDGELRFDKTDYLLREGTTMGATLFRGFMGSVAVSDPSGTGKAHIYTANAAGGPYDTPCIRYEAGKLVVRWDAEEYDGTTATGVKSMEVTCDGFVADGTLNHFVTGRHNNYLFVRLNGKLVKGPARPWNGNNNTQGKTIIGPRADQGDTTGVTIKYLAGLQGELPESFGRKAEEWLAGNEPEYEAGPTVPQFDKAAWDAWVAANPRNASKYREHMGKPALPLDGYTPVYREDFRANRVGAGGKVNTFSPSIYAQGANPAVGGDGATKNPFLDDVPTPTYQYEPGSMTLLNEYRDGKWRAGALTSVSNSMHGRSFEGGYVFRWRTTSTSDIAGKLFWGMWGYGMAQRIYHHTQRQEFDFNEPDAENRVWGNWFSVHNHKPFIGGTGVPHHKIISQSITVKNGWPADLDQFSGKPITCEVRVDPDFVYLNIDLTSPEDMTDRTNLKEWMRFPTPPGFLARWYFMINTCIKNTGTWEPDRAKQYWLRVHGIEVWQRDAVVYALPAAFAGKPKLRVEGDIAHVDAMLREPLDFVEYVWCGSDGYTLGYTLEPSFPKEGVAKVLVRAIGGKDMPEAWSNELKL